MKQKPASWTDQEWQRYQNGLRRQRQTASVSGVEIPVDVAALLLALARIAPGDVRGEQYAITSAVINVEGIWIENRGVLFQLTAEKVYAHHPPQQHK